MIAVDWGSGKRAQIAVLRLEGPAAAPALSETARLDALPDLRSAFDPYRCESTVSAFSVAERHDELLSAYSLESRWPDSWSTSTCALWTLPFKRRESTVTSASKDVCEWLCSTV